jgi:hypothetical protein
MIPGLATLIPRLRERQGLDLTHRPHSQTAASSSKSMKIPTLRENREFRSPSASPSPATALRWTGLHPGGRLPTTSAQERSTSPAAAPVILPRFQLTWPFDERVFDAPRRHGHRLGAARQVEATLAAVRRTDRRRIEDRDIGGVAGLEPTAAFGTAGERLY